MKSLFKLKSATLLSALLLCVSAHAQTQPQCIDKAITATGRASLDLKAGAMERFGSLSLTYITAGVASLSFTAEAGNDNSTNEVPVTKISAQTSVSSGSPPTSVDAGSASGMYRHWFTNVSTLNAGTLTVHACYAPGNVSRAVVGPSGLTAGQAVVTNASKQLVSEPTYYADQYTGDWCAKVNAAGLALLTAYSTGGTVDARGLTGSQTCASTLTASGSGPVNILAGAATISVSTTMQPKSNWHITGLGQGVTLIKRASSFTSAHMINCQANSCSGFVIQDLTLDGNRSNVASATDELVLDAGSGNIVQRVTVQHTTGHGILIVGDTNDIVKDCYFTDINSNSLYIDPSTITATHHKISGNHFDSWGNFGLWIQKSNNNTVQGNTFKGTQVLANVDTTAVANSVVTCNACASFGTLAVGMYVDIGATRFTITVVTDTSHLTVNGNFTALTNQAAVLGSLEAINLDSGSSNTITANVTNLDSDCGIVLNSGAGGPTNSNSVTANTVYKPAFCGISLDGAGGTVGYNSISNNTILDARQYSNPPGSGDSGILIGSSGTVGNLITGNTLTDDQGGSATQQYGIRNASAGANTTGPNTYSGNVLGTIAGTLPINLSGSSIQANGIETTLYVTGNFTTANNTNFQTITGLSFTLPANMALNVPFHCALNYSQATAAVSDSFGIQAATINPTNIAATGHMQTNTTVATDGALTGLATTTATAIVTATPSAITTVWTAYLDGVIENPSNASANVINIQVKTTTGADAITVYRGSGCRIF